MARQQKTVPARPDAAVSLDLYKVMLTIRLAEQRVVELYPSDKIQSPIHLSIGQEAVSAGVCRALDRADHIHGTYRGHGIYLAKGGDLKRMFAELYGKDTGCARGKGGSMHLVAPEVGLMSCSAVVASTIPVAVGDALASRMTGRKRVSVAFFGDGAVDEGVFFESVNFAVLKDLPVVFVLENNGYAIHSKVADRHRQTRLWRIAEGLGLKGRRFDGNDAGLVYSVMKRTVDGIRKGSGPELIEFTTFRWAEHVGAGDDFEEVYRHPGERAVALSHDPIKLSEKQLVLRYHVTQKKLDAIKTHVLRDIDLAVDFAERSPFPSPDRLAADLFA